MICLGCKLSNSKIPILKVHESKNFIAIMDINPVSDGHIIILPLHHVEKLIDLSNDDVIELKEMIKHVQDLLIKKLNIKSFTLESNEGAVNDLNGHFHLHVQPREGKSKSEYTQIYKELME